MSELFDRLSAESEQLLNKIKASPSFQDAHRRYQHLNDRERLYVNIGALLFGLFIVYQIIISPALGYLTRGREDYQRELENVEWMRAQEGEIRQLIEANQSSREGSLLSVASATAKKYNLAFSRFDPDSDDKVRLWLEQVKFNDVVGWLSELENEQGVSAVDISVDSASPGYVSVRLTLQG